MFIHEQEVPDHIRDAVAEMLISITEIEANRCLSGNDSITVFMTVSFRLMSAVMKGGDAKVENILGSAAEYLAKEAGFRPEVH